MARGRRKTGRETAKKRMEQIIKQGSEIYYGNQYCKSIDYAYKLYRRDYHQMLGKAVYQRLDRLGQRTEYLHGYGFVFSDNSLKDRFDNSKRTKCYILCLNGLSYIRTMGIWDYSDIREEDFDDWLDWVYTRDGKHLRTVGVKDLIIKK